MADNDNGDDEVALVGVAKAPAVAAAAAATETIDLCGDDDDYTQNMMLQFYQDQQNDKKSRNKKRKAAALNSTADAIDLVNMDPQQQQQQQSSNNSRDDTDDAKETRYRQALGPVRMDFVAAWQPHSQHAFQQQPAASFSRVSSRNLYKELLEYKLNLPINWSGSIFCRAQESRSDLLRALITGPEGTPYANGCFFFDLYLQQYPAKAPQVKFLTTGGGRVRFNPNLYQCGKVCLSLLGTWQGPGWESGTSTILQVLVSIQGLILVPDPYFNEPGFERSRNTAQGKKESDKYSANIQHHTLQHALGDVCERAAWSIQNDNESSNHKHGHLYPEFADVIVRHLAVKATAIEGQLQEWTAQNKSLQSVANKIRKNLAAVVAHYESEREQLRQMQEEQKKPAARNTPETIELLE